ncbi:centrosomal protein of 112 kDa isoform X3 [Clupea harengus]|uniref:Centrosomal protein of 112 kDa isoform X3 n=1 Tax=Clupea harengus TaxID=7950 RepID=A0A6P8FNZ3_CLUHA|nr:centrosomal protein of 112 kDa isoform X3 [Clupea harengus]
MSKQEETWEKLDSDFDHYLVDMKPYVLKLPNRSERQRCALWIKKLCDPVACGSGLTGRKNRNMYTRLLLHMLRGGVLEGPFTQKPDGGSLKTLPTYLSIYFDEPLFGRPQEESPAAVPDWVSGELGHADDTWSSLLKDSSPAAHPRRTLGYDKSPSRPLASSPLKHTGRDDSTVNGLGRAALSPDDSDLEARLNSWNLGIENPRYLREKPIPLSPSAEMRAKVLEAKHQEEKLQLQQKHDAHVQKILERKNREMEDLKSLLKNKQKEAEETIRMLEKKVQSLVRESQVVRENKEKQIAELKKMAEQSADSLKNEWEKKLHSALSEMEQAKFELQKKHTENIQDLLEDTNQRLAKMEVEYCSQTQITLATELEARVKQLTLEVESGNALRQRVMQEKAELELHIAAISSELQEASRRCTQLQREAGQQSEQQEEGLRRLKANHEADLSHYQKEHAISAAKASEVMEGLEGTVAQLKEQLQESEHRRQKQIRDQEGQAQKEMADMQFNNEKKVRGLQSELDREHAEAKRKEADLQEALREKEEQLTRLREAQRLQAQQTESALEHFKRQVELCSEKAYADMRQQMEKVEADLNQSKAVREKQAKEFSYQLEDLKQRNEQQMVELRLQHEQERTHVLQQHNGEKDSLVQEHQREIGTLEEQARAAIAQYERSTQEWRKRDGQHVAELELQMQALREELLQAHGQRKQQLIELGLLREEERQRAAQEQEAALTRLRAEMERVRMDLERSHAAERELALEKSNSRLKQLEREYNQRLAKSAQTMADVQTAACVSREQSQQAQQVLEQQLQEAAARYEEERRRTSRHTDKACQGLQEKADGLQKQLMSTEKKLKTKELENQEQITHVRQECEMRLKGLMPAQLRQELEDTITSLKSQVNFLQKRAAVLQEDLEASRGRR